MSEHGQPIDDLDKRTADEIVAGARPTTNQPLHAEPRPRFTPGVLVLGLVVLVVAIILALTVL